MFSDAYCLRDGEAKLDVSKWVLILLYEQDTYQLKVLITFMVFKNS